MIDIAEFIIYNNHTAFSQYDYPQLGVLLNMNKICNSVRIIKREGRRKEVLMDFKDPEVVCAETERKYEELWKHWLVWFRKQEPEATIVLEIIHHIS